MSVPGIPEPLEYVLQGHLHRPPIGGGQNFSKVGIRKGRRWSRRRSRSIRIIRIHMVRHSAASPGGALLGAASSDAEIGRHLTPLWSKIISDHAISGWYTYRLL